MQYGSLQNIVDELGAQVAVAAVTELASRSFGAVDTVAYHSATEQVTDDDSHWVMIWNVGSIGIEEEIKLVLLPEFLDADPELLISQFASMLIEKALDRED